MPRPSWRACIQHTLPCDLIPSRSFMKSRRVFAAMLISFAGVLAASGQYQTALPGYHYNFPRDHFNHPDFQTEWWYYTGNIKSRNGHRFGFELTFFRQGVDRDAKSMGAWDVHDLYLAHLALSDMDGGQFLHAERTNREGPGRASHYISLTRLNTQGKIELEGQTFQVTGAAWMDHEFFTHQLETDQVGWDWLSIQLADNSELMLFNIRRRGGSIDAYSAGTFVDARGNATHLARNEFLMQPADSTWLSPATNAAYPLRWKISIPKLNIALECSTSLPSQELASPTGFVPAYWEGSVLLAGSKGGSPIAGVGYLEMTGCDHPVEVLR